MKRSILSMSDRNIVHQREIYGKNEEKKIFRSNLKKRYEIYQHFLPFSRSFPDLQFSKLARYSELSSRAERN